MKFSPSRLSVALILLITIWVSSNLNWGKDHWKGIMESDAKGYYAYLPATFIYHDLNYGFFDSIEKEKYYSENFYYDYRSYHEGRTINKYYCGTAILQMPVFLVAHLTAKLSGQPADGYSKIYCVGVNIAGLLYLFMGLWFMMKLLHLYGIGEWNTAFSLMAIVFGTNLFYYAVVEPGMSHVYSFALISAFLYHAKMLVQVFSPRRLLLLGLLSGLIFLVRPVNMMILAAVPFVASSRENFIGLLKNASRKMMLPVVALTLLLAVCSVQFLIYKASAGIFFIYSYGEEGFNFSSPHIKDILFSYRKGLFVYTPLYLVALGGTFYFFRRSGWEAFFFVLFFFLLTYILSSWWSWWYGGSFSSRPFVEYLPLFGLSLAIMLQNLQRLPKKIVIGVVVLLVLLCQVQIYQYRYDQIHWDGMTKEKYWDVFLRLDKLA